MVCVCVCDPQLGKIVHLIKFIALWQMVPKLRWGSAKAFQGLRENLLLL
jgi:hypothetical protein